MRPKIIELIINKFLLINSPLYVVANALLGMTHTDKMRIGIVFADMMGKKIYAYKYLNQNIIIPIAMIAYHFQNSDALTKELKKQFRLFQIERIVYALLMAAMGVLFILMPAQSANVLCTITGVVLLSVGLVLVITYFMRTVLFGGLSLVFGMLLTLSGILCLIHPEVVQSLLTVLMGLIVIVDGSSLFMNSIECARVKIKGWFWMLLLSLLVLALGGVVLFGNFTAVMYVAGCALIIDALSKVIITLVFGNRIHEAHKQIHDLRNTFYEDNTNIQDVPYEEVKE